jgi:hypothetical protein
MLDGNGEIDETEDEFQDSQQAENEVKEQQVKEVGIEMTGNVKEDIQNMAKLQVKQDDYDQLRDIIEKSLGVFNEIENEDDIAQSISPRKDKK